jgi:hypothetical protein
VLSILFNNLINTPRLADFLEQLTRNDFFLNLLSKAMACSSSDGCKRQSPLALAGFIKLKQQSGSIGLRFGTRLTRLEQVLHMEQDRKLGRLKILN